MAKTPAQLGMSTPAGSDFISQGDNAITTNATQTATWIGNLLEGAVEPKAIASNADLLTLPTGWHYCRLTTTAATITNRPTGIGDGPFIVRMVRTAFGHSTITYYGYSGSANGIYENHTGNSTHTNWVGWKRLDNETVGSSGVAGVANTLRVQEFRDAIGTVNTNGRGAIALRFDHGLSAFNNRMRPSLEARNIPYSLALSARNFNAGENAGVTAAMVDSWVGCEVWNHGANQHQDQSTVSGLTDQIVTGKTELQALLPNKEIWGYAVPGTGGTGQGGFGGGSNPEAFYSTLAGDLILTNHAVSTGAFSGTARRPLDGRIRQGMAHFTIEAQTVARIKLEIDNAITNRTGNQLMMHPSLLDTAGYLTRAQFLEVLDYIVSKRDSGELVVLSPYQMMVADAQTEKAFTSRNITALWDGGTGGGNVTLARTGNTVTLNVYGTTSSTEYIKYNAAPLGFRPPSNSMHFNPFYGTASTSARLLVYSNGRIDLLSNTAGVTLYGTVSWPTNDPWPTALPGTAA
ncbi:hypothetical protein ACIOTN_17325 [Glutamicibacter sp. NPDC087661]|uniref:hypothetical protein n=1 Tax=Glutamicibacter sp. NPDC087661 TaxID=3363996 RepID=UPI003817B7FF